MTRLDDAIRRAKPISDGQHYRVIHLPRQAITAATGIVAQIGEPFLGFIADADEVTLVVPVDAAGHIQQRLPDAQISDDWRLITFDAVLEHDLVGFMARIATALAHASVSIFALSAYERDHLLVKADQFDAAMNALTTLSEGS